MGAEVDCRYQEWEEEGMANSWMLEGLFVMRGRQWEAGGREIWSVRTEDKGM